MAAVGKNVFYCSMFVLDSRHEPHIVITHPPPPQHTPSPQAEKRRARAEAEAAAREAAAKARDAAAAQDAALAAAAAAADAAATHAGTDDGEGVSLGPGGGPTGGPAGAEVSQLGRRGAKGSRRGGLKGPKARGPPRRSKWGLSNPYVVYSGLAVLLVLLCWVVYALFFR